MVNEIQKLNSPKDNIEKSSLRNSMALKNLILKKEEETNYIQTLFKKKTDLNYEGEDFS